MVAQNHPFGPAVRLGIRDGRVKNRPIPGLCRILRPRHQRQSRFDGETIRRSQPGVFIGKRRMLPGARRIKMQGANAPGIIAQKT
jgi:hypothetical protein